ncbi:hypothetical protein CRG98_018032 [Punica granatum]|uniref:Topoisomerase 6 subunit A/Spo11 TOPRIM domain-containing protein n=1 Tax=Punica granatum TaxID=22663 RepID=A0A2I0K1E9_PUNGR|nr:hypothetical protein CRG98_018032 [Punica granatum]
MTTRRQVKKENITRHTHNVNPLAIVDGLDPAPSLEGSIPSNTLEGADGLYLTTHSGLGGGNSDDNKDTIDYTKMGLAGNLIFPNMDKIVFVRFMCIIVTGKGQPYVATRIFLRKIKMELKLPILAFAVGDPYGFDILTVYTCGSRILS